MWLRLVIFLSCCLFPLRWYDLYLKLLVAAPQTLITGNGKHVTEPEWIWKGRTCRLGCGNLHTLISGEPYSKHASHKLPGGRSTLCRADGLPLRCKGQRVCWAQILWVSDCLKRLHSTNTRTVRREFPNKTEMGFSGVVSAPGVCHAGLEEGLCFTDGRADVSVLLRGFWLQDLV